MEELQDQRAVVGAPQGLWQRVHPGGDQRFPAQLRRLHVDHSTAAYCGGLRATANTQDTGSMAGIVWLKYFYIPSHFKLFWKQNTLNNNNI